jgi:hypothetical protein
MRIGNLIICWQNPRNDTGKDLPILTLGTEINPKHWWPIVERYHESLYITIGFIAITYHKRLY